MRELIMPDISDKSKVALSQGLSPHAITKKIFFVLILFRVFFLLFRRLFLMKVI